MSSKFVIPLFLPSVGFASMTVPVYISETAPSNIRGRLVVINTLFITGGQFVATVIDGLFSIQHDFAVENGWRYVFSECCTNTYVHMYGMYVHCMYCILS